MPLLEELMAHFGGARVRVDLPGVGRPLYARPWTLADEREAGGPGFYDRPDADLRLLLRKLEEEDGTPCFPAGNRTEALNGLRRTLPKGLVRELAARIVAGVPSQEEAAGNSPTSTD